MDGFCNEESNMCLLPKSFKNYHIQLAEDKEEEETDITKNIPGMPPSNTSSSKKEPTSKKPFNKSKIIKQEDVENALNTIEEAKKQNTWNSGEESFFKT